MYPRPSLRRRRRPPKRFVSSLSPVPRCTDNVSQWSKDEDLRLTQLVEETGCVVNSGGTIKFGGDGMKRIALEMGRSVPLFAPWSSYVLTTCDRDARAIQRHLALVFKNKNQAAALPLAPQEEEKKKQRGKVGPLPSHCIVVCH
jgi:hypothetical protein